MRITTSKTSKYQISKILEPMRKLRKKRVVKAKQKSRLKKYRIKTTTARAIIQQEKNQRTILKTTKSLNHLGRCRITTLRTKNILLNQYPNNNKILRIQKDSYQLQNKKMSLIWKIPP